MPLDIKRIQGICFDVDGTLSDTDDLFVHKLVRGLRPFRHLFPDKNLHPFARRLVMATESPGNMLLGLTDRWGLDGGIDRVGDFIYRLGLGRSPEPFLLIQGVGEMLLQLRETFPLSVVSARGRRNTLRFLHQFDLTAHFICVAARDACQHTKPYPDPVLWAAQQMGVPPQAVLMVGDTVVDIRAGKAAGAQTVGVLCGFGQEEELRQAGADLILPDTAALTAVLLNSYR